MEVIVPPDFECPGSAFLSELTPTTRAELQSR
jgi:hypothetical protein